METEKKSNGYMMIPVKPATYKALADVLPKSMTWDEAISALTDMWTRSQGKVVKSGKLTSDNQTS